jgi:dethiobiotin synthetase
MKSVATRNFKTGKNEGLILKSVLITGTDTGVGKTIVCRHLAAYMQSKGVNVITQKWVQTGCDYADDIKDHMLKPLPAWNRVQDIDDLRTPYRLKHPASPHFAAYLEGVEIDIKIIEESHALLCKHFDLVLVEGSGGVLVPLTEKTLLADLAARLKMAVVIVVLNKLGCINHALLSIEALRLRRILILGLIFNRMDDQSDEAILRENVRIISLIAGVPVIGEMPFLKSDADGFDRAKDVSEAFYKCWREDKK